MKMAVYCAQCSKQVSTITEEKRVALAGAHVHADITGHVVQIVQLDTWASIQTVAGEPALPLWEPSGEE